MLHPVNPPDCIDDMKTLLDYQRKFLSLLLLHPDPLSKLVFESYLGKEIGRWNWKRVYRGGKLTKKQGQHVVSLVEYAKKHRADCRNVLRVIRHDHLFFIKFTDPAFSFKFSTLTEEWRNALTPFLQSFYEILHKPGYSAEAFEFTQGKLEWRSFMNAQYSANPDVCPYCDGEQGDYTKRIDANDAEHWLPKSKYPHLSIHWANLFRTCMVCNERFKGDDNPIKYQGCGELEKTYHPYQQPASCSAEVSVSQAVSFPRQYTLKVDDHENSERADAMEQVLCLSERWSERINKRLKTNKSALIADQVREVRYKKGGINADWVSETLSMIAKFRNEEIGEKPNALLENAVLNFQATEEVDSIYFALARAHR